MGEATASKPLGFWRGWGLGVGAMIGSGIFMMPPLLAPYGWLGMGGWLITGTGALMIALVYARLSRNIAGSGGPYRYAHSGLGNVAAFVASWGYWLSLCAAIPAIAVAAVGYLTFLMPETLAGSPSRIVAGLIIIWSLVAINVRSVKASGSFMLITTILKILPLALIAVLAFTSGTPAPEVAAAPAGKSPLTALADAAMLTMWAFIGVECATVPAGEIENAKRTVPRILVAGVLTVLVIYLLSSLAIFVTIPPDHLAASTAPFADAANILIGSGAATVVTLGALISTIGATNAHILLAGQLPLAAAKDGFFPGQLAKTGRQGTPALAIAISALLGSLLLVFNYTEGLVAAFEYMILLSTFLALVPIALSALADAKLLTGARRHSGWAKAILINILALAYIIFVFIGAGGEIILHGTIFLLASLPFYFWKRRGFADHEPVTDYEL